MQALRSFALCLLCLLLVLIALPSRAQTAPPAPRDFLVWLANPHPRTVWVRASDGGGSEILAEVPAFVIATPSGAAVLRTQTRPWSFLDCTCIFNGTDTGDSWDSIVASKRCNTTQSLITDTLLIDLATLKPLYTFEGGPDRRPPGTFSSEDPSGYSQHDLSVSVLGSLGPWIFIEESLTVFHCGAHPATEHRLTIVNSTDGSTFDEPLSTYRSERIEEGVEAYNQHAIERGGELILSDEPGGPPVVRPNYIEVMGDFTAFWPIYDIKKGELGYIYQFSWSDCYACGDDVWSDYTSSERVKAGRGVGRFEKMGGGEVPEGVKRGWYHLAVEVGGEERGGWSEVAIGEGARGALLEAFKDLE